MTCELNNCDFCGRDTANKSRICRHCTSGAAKVTLRGEDLPGRESFGRSDDVEADVRRIMREMVEWN